MQKTTFEKERERIILGHRYVIGIDEVGRGPLAGPVVACAAMLKNIEYRISNIEKEEEDKRWDLIRDSKKLSEKQREKICEFIQEHFEVGIGIIAAETIDRVNILEATFLAMKSALSQLLKKLPREAAEQCYILIDGNQKIPNCSYHQECLIGGDGIVKSIAAASIVAKVTRDRMMDEYEKQYGGYGLGKHKGYGTKVHMDALRRLGPCPIHRMSFRPVFLSLPENANKRFANVLKPKKAK
ncbi:MAG: ribonuclease HII [Candidatus Moranbacteria bacterium]|nr:ribonuclease HII [Candidatus Moranbacteria bacterium]